MRQAISAQVFEGPDLDTFIEEMKVKMFRSTLRVWYGKLIFLPSPAIGQHVHVLGQSITDLGETTNPRNRYELQERLKTERKIAEPKSCPERL